MPTNKIKTPLLSGNFYHVYNKGNDGGKLFYTHANYRYFLRKYDELLSPFVKTHAYCLLGNHFHFLIKTNESDEPQFHLIISHQFRRLFQLYALAINKQEGREGSLFRKYFRRIQVNNMDYLRHLVFYIHFNPQKHLLIQDYKTYPYSSYSSYEKQESGHFLDVQSTLSWFNDYDDFLNYHDVMHDERKYKTVLLEDD